GVWIREYQGGHMTEISYWDATSEPLLYPLLYMMGEKGYAYGEEKLYPAGTTREQAGFTAEEDNWNDFATPPPSQKQEPMEVDPDDGDEGVSNRMEVDTESDVDGESDNEPVSEDNED
ncbi:hypothetical protein PMAYCL1PPCAC_16220, partial [Pristionchus mayeri]